MNEPQVSVVIPTHVSTHGRWALLERTVRCALAQREVSLEVVVVDDHSIDAAVARLDAWPDARVRRVAHRGARGADNARNTGIEAARGEWVAFLDDDDLWAPDKLQAQLVACRRSGRVWAYAGAVAIDPSLQILAGGAPPEPERVREEIFSRYVVPAAASNLLVRRDALAEVGGFDPELHHMGDWDMAMRLAAYAPPAAVLEPKVAYLLHAANMSLDPADQLRDIDLLERKHQRERDGRPLDRIALHRWIAWSALRRGDRKGALRAYAHAVAIGDLSSIGRAAIGCVYPPVVINRLRRTAIDGPWRARAEAWLRDLREPGASATSCSRPSAGPLTKPSEAMPNVSADASRRSFTRRPQLPAAELAALRRARRQPRITQWDYLHLAGLLRALRETVASLDVDAGPALDLYCGTQPYRDVIPCRPLIGVDMERYFGGADVIAYEDLPFADATFRLAICTQALDLVFHPDKTVAELERVLVPGGTAVVTVPHIIRRERAYQRRYDAAGLRRLFAHWGNVRVDGFDGLGTGLALVVGQLTAAVARHAPVLQPLVPLLAVPLNLVGALVDAVLSPLSRRWPAGYVVTATKAGPSAQATAQAAHAATSAAAASRSR